MKVLKRVLKDLRTIWREEAEPIVEGKAFEVTRDGNLWGVTMLGGDWPVDRHLGGFVG